LYQRNKQNNPKGVLLLTFKGFGDTILSMRKSGIKKILDEIDFVPVKRLGQNFLVSESIAERIVEAAALNRNSVVVEFGAGLGIITERILNRGIHVIAFEIDKKLVGYLKKRFYGRKEFYLREKDFFYVLRNRKFPVDDGKNLVLISNPPYKGVKKLLRYLSTMNIFSRIVITLPEEIANMLFLSPGESNANSLTYFVRYRYTPQKLFDIPPNFFYPQPVVKSTTVILSPTSYNLNTIDDEKFYFSTVEVLLKSRRRKLKNNIKSYFGLPEETVSSIMEKSHIPDDVRATELTVEQMLELSGNLLHYRRN